MKDYLNPLNLQPIKSIFLSTYLPEISNDMTVTDQYMINFINLWKRALTEEDHLYFLRTFLQLCQNEKNIPFILKYQIPYYVIHSYSSVGNESELLNYLCITLEKDQAKQMPKYLGLYILPIEFSFLFLYENYQTWNTFTIKLFIHLITLTIRYHVRNVESIGEMEIEIINSIFQQEPLTDIIDLVNQIIYSKRSGSVIEIIKNYYLVDSILLAAVNNNFDIACIKEILEIIRHISKYDISYVDYLNENCSECLTYIYGRIKDDENLLSIYNSIFSQ